MPGTGAGNFGELGKTRFDRGQCLAGAASATVDQAGGEPLGIVEQHLEHVLGRELLVAFAQGQRLRGLDETAGAVRVFLEIHVVTPSACSARPNGTAGTSSSGAWNAPDPSGGPLPRCRRRACGAEEAGSDFHGLVGSARHG